MLQNRYKILRIRNKADIIHSHRSNRLLSDKIKGELNIFLHQELIEELPKLKRFAHKLSNSTADAEDLTQTTITKALEKKDLFQEGTDLFKWSSKIMYNTFVSDYRRKTKFESKYDPEPYLEKQSTKPSQEDSVELKNLDDAMNNLSKESREILILVCIKGYKYKQVAKKLDIPVGTVRSRLARAREKLHNMMN